MYKTYIFGVKELVNIKINLTILHLLHVYCENQMKKIEHN